MYYPHMRPLAKRMHKNAVLYMFIDLLGKYDEYDFR